MCVDIYSVHVRSWFIISHLQGGSNFSRSNKPNEQNRFIWGDGHRGSLVRLVSTNTNTFTFLIVSKGSKSSNSARKLFYKIAMLLPLSLEHEIKDNILLLFLIPHWRTKCSTNTLSKKNVTLTFTRRPKQVAILNWVKSPHLHWRDVTVQMGNP